MNSLPTLPSQVIHYTFEYLTPQELVHIEASCRFLGKIAQSEKLPARLMIPKLPPQIIQENALTLWNFSEGNLNVDREGRLIHIETHHFLARFSKWNNLKSVVMKVHKAIEITLKEIYRLNCQGCLNPLTSPQASPPRRLYVWRPCVYSHYYPANYLADKILNSQKFIEAKIQKAAGLLKAQADLYAKIREKYGSPFTLFSSDQRVVLADCGLDEALFCKKN